MRCCFILVLCLYFFFIWRGFVQGQQSTIPNAVFELSNIQDYFISSTEALHLGHNATSIILRNVIFRSEKLIPPFRDLPLIFVNLTAMLQLSLPASQKVVEVVIEDCQFHYPEEGKTASGKLQSRGAVQFELVGPVLRPSHSTVVSISMRRNQFFSSNVLFQNFGFEGNSLLLPAANLIITSINIEQNLFNTTGNWDRWSNFPQPYLLLFNNFSLNGKNSYVKIEKNIFYFAPEGSGTNAVCFGLSEYVRLSERAEFRISENTFLMEKAEDAWQWIFLHTGNELSILSGSRYIISQNTVKMKTRNVTVGLSVLGAFLVQFGMKLTLSDAGSVMNVSQNNVDVDVGHGSVAFVNYEQGSTNNNYPPSLVTLSQDARILISSNIFHAVAYNREIHGVHWDTVSMLNLFSGAQYVINDNSMQFLADQSSGSFVRLDCRLECLDDVETMVTSLLTNEQEPSSVALVISGTRSAFRIENNIGNLNCLVRHYCQGFMLLNVPVMMRNGGFFIFRHNDLTIHSDKRVVYFNVMNAVTHIQDRSTFLMEGNAFHGEEFEKKIPNPTNSPIHIYGWGFEGKTVMNISNYSALILKDNRLITKGGGVVKGIYFAGAGRTFPTFSGYSEGMMNLDHHSVFEVTANHFDLQSTTSTDINSLHFLHYSQFRISDASHILFSRNNWHQRCNMTSSLCKIVNTINNFFIHDRSTFSVADNNFSVKNIYDAATDGQGAGFWSASTVVNGFGSISLSEVSVYQFFSNSIFVSGGGGCYAFRFEKYNVKVQSYSSLEFSENEIEVYSFGDVRSASGISLVAGSFQFENHTQFLIASNRMNITSQMREPSCLFVRTRITFSINSSWRMEGNELNATRNEEGFLVNPRGDTLPDGVYTVLFYSLPKAGSPNFIAFGGKSQWLFLKNKMKMLLKVPNILKDEILRFMELQGLYVLSKGSSNYFLFSNNEFIGQVTQPSVVRKGKEFLIMKSGQLAPFFTGGLRNSTQFNADILQFRCNYVTDGRAGVRTLLTLADYRNMSLFYAPVDFQPSGVATYPACNECFLETDCAPIPGSDGVRFVAPYCDCLCQTYNNFFSPLTNMVTMPPGCYFNYTGILARLALEEWSFQSSNIRFDDTPFIYPPDNDDVDGSMTNTIHEVAPGEHVDGFSVSRTPLDEQPLTTLLVSSSSSAATVPLSSTADGTAGPANTVLPSSGSTLPPPVSNTAGSGPQPSSTIISPQSSSESKWGSSSQWTSLTALWTHLATEFHFASTTPPPSWVNQTEGTTGGPHIPTTVLLEVVDPYVNDTVLMPEGEKITAIASTSATVAVSAVAGSSAGGMELQGLVALSGIECASPSMRSLAANGKKTVTMLDVGDSSAAGLYGQLILIAAVFFLHTMVVLLASQTRGIPLQEVMMTLRFPDHSFRVCCILYQGLLMESCRVLFDNDEDSVIAGIAFALGILIPCFGIFWSRKKSHVQFITYNASVQSYPHFLRRFVFPYGFWNPEFPHSKKYSCLFSSLTATNVVWVSSFPFLKAVLTSLIVHIHSGDCSVRLNIAGGIQVLMALILCIVRPFRSGATQLTLILLTLLGGLVAFGLAPSSLEGFRQLTSTFLTMASAVAIINILFSIAFFFLERKWKRIEMEFLLEENKMKKKKKEVGIEGEQDEEEDDPQGISCLSGEEGQPLGKPKSRRRKFGGLSSKTVREDKNVILEEEDEEGYLAVLMVPLKKKQEKIERPRPLNPMEQLKWIQGIGNSNSAW